VAIFGLYAQSAAAQSMTAQAIKDAALIDIPFVMGDIDPGQGADMLWATGDRPANSLLAKFSIRPLQVATMAIAGTEQARPLLWRAFPGGGITRLRSDDLKLADGPRYFCGPVGSERGFSCFVDEDGNGSFDHAAEAIAERGAKPYHITIIKAVRPLNTPQAYQILADELRPAVTIELRNCARDYDRPRYAALSTADRNVPVASSTFTWHDKDSSFASCRRGSELDSSSDRNVVIPKGGYLAEMGPLAFAVGPKKNAKLTLAGPVDPYALYRLEGANLVSMNIGHTPNQAELIALKKFPYPVLMTDAGAVIHDGSLATGDRLATVPFRHAYRGKLTQDISISTLFGKRSLAAGTVVYGFPAQFRITRTVRGIPDLQTVGDEEYRNIKLELTWCAPVHDVDPGKEKPNAIGKGGWSAACIPHSTLGTHTIITDLQPAFGVANISYNVDTSSNDGPPPIERADESGFEQSLRIDYIYEGQEGEFVSLREQIYFGQELTSSMPKKLYAPSGKVIVAVAGTGAELTTTGTGDLTVKPAGSALIGSNPLLTWDQRAYMAEQLKKMGMRLAEPEANADAAANNAAGVAN
jgi:hypothetical protein